MALTSPASYREASEFDFFRGQPGRKDRPDIHDDGRLAEEPIRKMKGFTDVGCTMLTRERWGAAKFVQGQLRVFVCNDYTYTDWAESHQHTVSGTVLYMKHEQFLEVISPVFPKDTTTPHIVAVLKRANILVNVGKLMFFRRATQDEITVPCLCTGSAVNYLKPDAQTKYIQYRDSMLAKPSSFEADVEWEATYVDALLAGKNLPRARATIINNGAVLRLFHGEPNVSSAAAPSTPPAAAPPVPKPVVVKEEPRSFRRALTGLSGQVVDLCSPPKKAAKTRALSDVKAELAEDSEPNGIIAAAVIPPELSSSSSCLDSAHAVELGPVGSPMDVASQETTPHDPMDDLSQELERLMDDDETS